jgi:hypothetical protein
MMLKSSLQLQLNRRCKSKQRATPSERRVRFSNVPGFQIHKGDLSCETKLSTNNTAFERTSKRRKGYPSETKVKRGMRVVHGEKELVEKLGRNDLCPCGSGRRFQALLSPNRQIRRHQPRLLFSASSQASYISGCSATKTRSRREIVPARFRRQRQIRNQSFQFESLSCPGGSAWSQLGT